MTQTLLYYPPLQPWYVPLLAVVGYWITIFAIQRIMKDKKPWNLKYFSAIHNFNMVVISVVMAVGVGRHIRRIYSRYGMTAAYCGVNDEEDSEIAFWSNVFYLSKYYEYLDTVILALKKKELSLLHVFHHSVTAPVSWFAIHSEILMGWITVFNNSVIHIFMYYYYMMQSLGHNVWWKKYLTTGQIIQFAIDCTTSIPFFLLWKNNQPCRGTIEAWIVGNLGGFSLFFLFINFYIQTYIHAKKRKSA